MVKLEDMEQKLQSLRNLDGRSICICISRCAFQLWKQMDQLKSTVKNQGPFESAILQFSRGAGAGQNCPTYHLAKVMPTYHLVAPNGATRTNSSINHHPFDQTVFVSCFNLSLTCRQDTWVAWRSRHPHWTVWNSPT